MTDKLIADAYRALVGIREGGASVQEPSVEQRLNFALEGLRLFLTKYPEKKTPDIIAMVSILDSEFSGNFTKVCASSRIITTPVEKLVIEGNIRILIAEKETGSIPIRGDLYKKIVEVHVNGLLDKAAAVMSKDVMPFIEEERLPLPPAQDTERLPDPKDVM